MSATSSNGRSVVRQATIPVTYEIKPRLSLDQSALEQCAPHRVLIANRRRGGSPLRSWALGICVVVLLLGWPVRGYSQSIETTLALPNGFLAGDAAINPATNTIYVGNAVSSHLMVFNGDTDTYNIISIPNGTGAIDVNPVTNTIYVANSSDDVVTVINGATNATTTVPIPMGSEPSDVAVNTITNKIYVASFGGHYLTVIDGATNDTSTVSVGTQPVSVAVNEATNQVYVVDQGSNASDGFVTVLDGAIGSTPATVVATLQVGPFPSSVAVNPVTNKAYVANGGFGTGSTVTVINGATDTVSATITTGTEPSVVAVNPVTNQIYVVNTDAVDSLTGSPSASVVAIDGATNNVTTLLTGAPYATVHVNPLTNQIYVGDYNGNMTVLNGQASPPSVVATLFVGGSQIVMNPVTNSIYALGTGSTTLPPGEPPIFSGATLSVVDGATNHTVSLAPASQPYEAAVNPATDTIYVYNQGSPSTFPEFASTVSVINGANNTLSTTVPVGMGASTGSTEIMAVNPVTNLIYVVNDGDNTVSVIDGATNAVAATVQVGTSPEAVAVNPVTNMIYVTNSCLLNTTCSDTNAGTVSVISGSTNAVVATIAVGKEPDSLVVNPLTDTIYVADNGSSMALMSGVIVINGATDEVIANVPAGNQPSNIAVNTVTNTIYVSNYCLNASDLPGPCTVTVIDGATNASTGTVPVGIQPDRIGVNPVTNNIYVANLLSGTVTAIDGATNTPTTLTLSAAGMDKPSNVAVNPATNKIYVSVATLNSTDEVMVIDGATNAFTTVNVGVSPWALAVNPATNEIYVPNTSSQNVTVISEEQVQPVPLTTTISSTAIVGGVTTNPTPPFTFAAVSAFSPTAPAVDNVYFQMDTTCGQWTLATPGDGNFTGTPTTALSLGTHIVYAFATDGQDASSEGGDAEELRQALTGPIAAEVFTVTGTSTSLVATTTGVISNNNPSVLGQSVMFTAGVSPAEDPMALPTGTVTFYDGGTELGTGTIGSGTPATYTTSTLTAGSHSITAVYGGDSNYSGSTSGVLTQVVDNPLPTLTSLSQNSATAGSAGFTLMLTGTNFLTSSVAQWNGVALSTTYVSATQLNATIPTGDLASVGSASITVFNPTPGGGTSTPALTFTINAAVVGTPTIASLVPSSAVVGGPAFTLTVNGTNFISTSVVQWNGTGLATTDVSATQLTASVPATDIATAGVASVTVFNPTVELGVRGENARSLTGPTGTTSSAVTFDIVDFTVSSSTSPQTVSAGSSAMFSISTASVDGTFPNTVTFTASGLPTGAVAMFSPGSVTPGTGSTMTVTTQGCTATAALPSPFAPRGPGFPLSSPRSLPVWLALLALAVLLAGAGIAGRTQRKPLRRLVPVAAMILLIVTAGYLAGCAGGFPELQGSTCTATPSGTYTITVTATSGSDVHTTTVTLTIGTVNL